MLQIIGWMGCIYLIVKGIEFVAHAGYRNTIGRMKISAIAGAAFAWLGAILIFVAINLQAGEFSGATIFADADAQPEAQAAGKSVAWQRCIDQASNADEAAACREID